MSPAISNVLDDLVLFGVTPSSKCLNRLKISAISDLWSFEGVHFNTSVPWKNSSSGLLTLIDLMSAIWVYRMVDRISRCPIKN